MLTIVKNSKIRFSDPLTKNNLFTLKKYFFIYYAYLSVEESKIRLCPFLFSSSNNSLRKLYKYHVQFAIIRIVFFWFGLLVFNFQLCINSCYLFFLISKETLILYINDALKI